VFNHFAGRTISSGFNGTYSFDMIGSYLEGWDYSILNGHSEFYIGAPGRSSIGHVNIDHSVIMQDWQAANFGPGALFTAYSWPVNAGPLSINYDVFIASSTGGTTSSPRISGCVGATFMSENKCSGAGSNFFLTAISGGTLGQGLSFNCGAPFIGIVSQIGGAGAGYLSEWSVDSNDYAGFGTVGPASCTNVVANNHINTWGFVVAGGMAPITSISVQNLYGDFASTPTWGSMLSNSKSLPHASISGGVLTTSSSITTGPGVFVYAADVPGCSVGGAQPFIGCPTITTGGTGTTFNLTGSSGSQGPEAMTLWAPSYCNTPAAIQNNVDMSGTLKSKQMNHWSAGGEYCSPEAACEVACQRGDRACSCDRRR
jgi:hypothetical protein